MRVYTGNPQKADPSDHIQLLFLFSMSTPCDGGSALGKHLSFQQKLWRSHVNYFANFLIRCNLYRMASSGKQDKDC